jgi:hypothetical protein
MKIIHHEAAHRTGPPAAAVGSLDPADELAQILAFTLDFVQCVPKLRLQTHAGSSAMPSDDIASD